MAPFYRGYQKQFQLDRDDMNAIQELYGKLFDFHMEWCGRGVRGWGVGDGGVGGGYASVVQFVEAQISAFLYEFQ